MKKMTKILGLGAAMAIAGTIGWRALAETPAQYGSGFGPPFMHGGMGMGRMGPGLMMGGAFGDPAEHLAALKTELGVTAAQEAAWNTYARTLQDTAAAMRAQPQDFDPSAIHAMSDQDRLAFFTQRFEEHQKAFATVKAAAEKLTPVLNEVQKVKAKYILPGVASPRFGMMHAGMGSPIMMMMHGGGTP